MERKYVWVVTQIPDNLVDEPILTAFDNEEAARNMYEERLKEREVFIDRVPIYNKYVVKN